jgi:hypothetical protein
VTEPHFLRACAPIGLAGLCQQAYFYEDNLFVRALRCKEELGANNVGVRILSVLIMVALTASQATKKNSNATSPIVYSPSAVVNGGFRVDRQAVLTTPALPLPSKGNHEARPTVAPYCLGVQEFTVSATQPVDRPETRMDAGSCDRNLPSTRKLA